MQKPTLHGAVESWLRYRRKILLAVCIATVTAYSIDYATAQNVVITEGVEIDVTQLGIILAIGTVAGFWRAWQGYKKTASDWDSAKFWDGVTNSILATIPIAMTTVLSYPQITMMAYFWTFFTVIGVANQYETMRKPTIPSNATPAQIAALTGDVNPNGEWARQNILRQLDNTIALFERHLRMSKEELAKWEAIKMPPGFEDAKEMFLTGIRNEIKKTEKELADARKNKAEVMSGYGWNN